MNALIKILVFVLPLPLHAASVTGVSGRSLFENYRDNFGGNFIDFTHGVSPMPGDRRLDSEFTGSLGVTFSTFQNPSLGPLGPHNVYVASGSPGPANTIVGTPCVGCSDDGRYPYKIEFINPQRFAGAQRIWNANTRTQFYSASNVLLHEASGTGFQGYESDLPDPATWVSRIEVTGVLDNLGNRQVGYTDDLFFGTTVPEPGSSALLVASLGAGYFCDVEEIDQTGSLGVGKRACSGGKVMGVDDSPLLRLVQTGYFNHGRS